MPWPANSPIDFSAVGDNVVVTAGHPTHRVKVWRIFFIVSAATTVTIKDGAGISLSGPMAMLANGSLVFDMIPGTRNTDVPWFRTSPGNAFIINQTAGAQVSGTVYFSTGASID